MTFVEKNLYVQKRSPRFFRDERKKKMRETIIYLNKFKKFHGKILRVCPDSRFAINFLENEAGNIYFIQK